MQTPKTLSEMKELENFAMFSSWHGRIRVRYACLCMLKVALEKHRNLEENFKMRCFFIATLIFQSTF